MDFWVDTRRVARYGFIGFVRNGFISLSAVLVMTITLFVIANVIISNAALSTTLEELQEKVDVTVYFTLDALEEDIFAVQQSLEALPEVAFVNYVSKEEALQIFRERHKNDQLTLQALDELGENPLGASLEIRAKETSQYESIAESLRAQQGAGGAAASIDKINFYQNKAAIDRLTEVISTSRENSAAKILLLAFATIVIAFNTIRLAIYTSRDEIGVMNLVGAGHWYVRGPFMIAGVLYGLISGIIVLLLLYPILAFRPVLIGLDSTSEILFGNFDTFEYFVSSFPLFFLIIISTGVLLGALSSYLAVRRYLHT